MPEHKARRLPDLSPISIFQTADMYFTLGQVKIGKTEFKLDFLSRRISRRMRMFQALRVVAFVLILVWSGLGIYLTLYV